MSMASYRRPAPPSICWGRASFIGLRGVQLGVQRPWRHCSREYVHPPSHFKRLQLKHRNYGHTDSSQANSTKFWRDNVEEVTTSQISKSIAVKENVRNRIKTWPKCTLIVGLSGFQMGAGQTYWQGDLLSSVSGSRYYDGWNGCCERSRST